MFMNPILIKVDRSETPSKQLCSGSTVPKTGNQQRFNTGKQNRNSGKPPGSISETNGKVVGNLKWFYIDLLKWEIILFTQCITRSSHQLIILKTKHLTDADVDVLFGSS